MLIQALTNWKKDDYVKTELVFNQFLEKANEKKDPQWKTLNLLFSPFVFYATQNHQKSVESTEILLKSLSSDGIWGDIQSPDLEKLRNVFRIFLSQSYASLNKQEKAISTLRQAMASIDQKLKQENQTQAKADLYNSRSFALNILAEVYRQNQQQDKAIQSYREALEMALTASEVSPTSSDNSGIYSNPALSYVGLGRIYQARNMPVVAITYYKQAVSRLEQAQKDGAITLLSSVGGKPSDLAIANASKFFRQFMLKRGDLGDLGRTKIANVYRELADVLISQGRIAEAQQVLELLKIQELNDFTKGTRAPETLSDIASNDVEKSILKRHGTLIAFGQTLQQCIDTNCAQKSQLLQQRTVLVEQYNQAVQKIETQFRENSAKDLEYLKPNSQFSTTAQNIIDKQREKGIGTALLYPLVLDNKLWIVLVTEGGVLKRYEVAVSQKDLGDTVVAFQQQLRSPNSDLKKLQATSKQLYDWIIPKALETELNATDKTGKRKVQHLVFALDRVTRYIPMSALFDGQQYLAEKYAISTITAASQTDWIQGVPSNPQQVPALVMGVSEATGKFAALPNVPSELDAIVKQDTADPDGIYPGSEVLNGAFTFEALSNNLAGHRILHIATHGQFVPGRANDSYLLLGNGKPLAIPAINTLQELRKVDLVVLSACETALGGTDKDGIEINGISSYFLSKGAKAVMASLWLVNDASTSLLMQQFYKNLASGTMTKSEAMRQVQIQFIKGNLTAANAPQRTTLVPKGAPPAPKSPSNFAHPFYWAPFILIGNGL